MEKKNADPHGFNEMDEWQLTEWLGGGNAIEGSITYNRAKLVLEQKRHERLIEEMRPGPEVIVIDPGDDADPEPPRLTEIHVEIAAILVAIFVAIGVARPLRRESGGRRPCSPSPFSSSCSFATAEDSGPAVGGSSARLVTSRSARPWRQGAVTVARVMPVGFQRRASREDPFDRDHRRLDLCGAVFTAASGTRDGRQAIGTVADELPRRRSTYIATAHTARATRPTSPNICMYPNELSLAAVHSPSGLKMTV